MSPRASQVRIGVGLVLVALASAAVYAYSGALGTSASGVRATPRDGGPLGDDGGTAEATAAGATIERLDNQIRFHRRRADEERSWLDYERAATHLMSRARLSGRFEDYVEAQEDLRRSFAASGEAPGPVFTQARLDFTLHRLGAVEARLAELERQTLLPATTRTALAEMRADLSFMSGRYDEALDEYEARRRSSPSYSVLARLAQYRWKTGEHERADDLLVEAAELARSEGRQTQAWVELQRGLLDLDRGRLDDAMTHYRHADTFFDGWYLVEEHMAEILARKGRVGEAVAMYRDLVERTDNPELIDALAEVTEDPAEADGMRARSRERYEAWLAVLPESAYGHALSHFLRDGTVPDERVVDLAERNHALRPGADSKVLLAQAYARAGRMGDARRVIDEALRTPWSTAELHATAHVIFGATGDAELAEVQADRARAINPHALDELAWLAH